MVSDNLSDTVRFSIKIYLTTLDGDYINAYKVVNGVAVIRHKKPADRLLEGVQANMAEEVCWGIACGMEGDEIVINAKSGGGSKGEGSISIVINGLGSGLSFGNVGFPNSSVAG